MNVEAIMGSEIYTWVLIPLFIFIARIFDVTLGTMRFVFISKGLKNLAPVFGFFEVIIWLLAIGQIMQNLSNVMCYLAYGLGFASGTYVGLFIEEKLSLGMVMIRIITRLDSSALVQYLRYEKGYGVTIVDAHGKSAETKVIFTIISRKDLKPVVSAIKGFNPQAFYSVEEIKEVGAGRFPMVRARKRLFMRRWAKPQRKGK